MDSASSNPQNLSGILNNLAESISMKEKIYYIKTTAENFLEAARVLKEHGFIRLLTVSAVHWIDQKQFEVYFIANDPKRREYVKVSTLIPQDNPRITSLREIWPNASMHERETWELFGIFFENNDMLEPLFLEDWKEIPPFRKDFDLYEYAEKQYAEEEKL
ncbi:MAG: NADH-quinone oxidoreductase subunit C [Candidatus Njordarchaeota archaeon]